MQCHRKPAPRLETRGLLRASFWQTEATRRASPAWVIRRPTTSVAPTSRKRRHYEPRGVRLQHVCQS